MTGSKSTRSTSTGPEDQVLMFQVLQPLYAELVREFVVEVPPCPFDADSRNLIIAKVEAWLQQVDSEIQVHQLRQFLQTTPLANEPALRYLLLHHLRKSAKSDADRDKIDFLLVQYFSFSALPGLLDSDVEFEYVAQVLEPILGGQEMHRPSWTGSLETILQSATRCRRLSELLHGGMLEQSRKLKAEAGNSFYDLGAMVAFVRFNFLVRRIFFRLMHEDLNTIQDGLRELERRGIAIIDCRRAQFSADEPISRLRLICQSWKVMFHAEYSSGQPLRMLVDLRAAVDDALNADSTIGKLRKPLAAKAAAGTLAGSDHHNL